ncbi:hypothetical protein U0070_006554 [Myodes glareolus]|uniref:Uncharacterized protein n=1 Tax=Myodes glareolus TaxID=447135 RepID=A0AAW0JP67_MYOGA
MARATPRMNLFTNLDVITSAKTRVASCEVSTKEMKRNMDCKAVAVKTLKLFRISEVIRYQPG